MQIHNDCANEDNVTSGKEARKKNERASPGQGAGLARWPQGLENAGDWATARKTATSCDMSEQHDEWIQSCIQTTQAIIRALKHMVLEIRPTQ
jgi:hypothetical protein